MSDFDPKSGTHGTSKITEVPKRGRSWLLWILGLLALLLLLALLMRACGHRDTTSAAKPAAVAALPVTPPVAIEKVTLPGGAVVDLQPNTFNYELQRFLASSDPTPRQFTFDHLNFATSSAVLPEDAQPTVNALAQILTAYPKAKVALAGYADSTGPESTNVQLGAQRAQAVRAALVDKGVAESRMSLATGGSKNPTASNASVEGRAENRRTELVVTAK